MADEATRLARSLMASGIEKGDRVAYLCQNLPEMLTAHFGVPLAQAVLVAINTRLSADEITYILNHSGAKMLVGDTELLEKLEPTVGQFETVTEIVALHDLASDVDQHAGPEVPFATTRYADLLARGSDETSCLAGGVGVSTNLDQLHLRNDGPPERAFCIRTGAPISTR